MTRLKAELRMRPVRGAPLCLRRLKILFEFRLIPRHHVRSLGMLNSAIRIPHSALK